MENESEVIVDPNNEEVVEEEIVEEAPQEEKVEKPVESPEDKAARLLRQTNQARKKLNLPPVGEVKEAKEVKIVSKDGLSSTDVYVLMEAKVPSDDIDDVVDYARMKGISLKEALASNVVKTILKDKVDERNAAEATSTKLRTRTTSKPMGGESYLEKASKTGELPESDDDFDKLAEARMKQRKEKK